MLRNAHPRLMLAYPQLRLKQQLLRSRDGNRKWHENISIPNQLFSAVLFVTMRVLMKSLSRQLLETSFNLRMLALVRNVKKNCIILEGTLSLDTFSELGEAASCSQWFESSAHLPQLLPIALAFQGDLILQLLGQLFNAHLGGRGDGVWPEYLGWSKLQLLEVSCSMCVLKGVVIWTSQLLTLRH